LRIFTTLNPFVQEQWEQGVARRLGLLERRAGRVSATGDASDGQDAANTLQTAAVVTDVHTGEILALIGDRDPHLKGFNRALDARRPVGSLFKPVIALTALQKGYTMASMLDDTQLVVPLEGGRQWIPKNYDGKEHGKVPLQFALANSYNLAFARLAQELGIEAVADNLLRLGIVSDLPRVPALALGSADLPPIEVAALYQTLAANGFYTPLRSIRSVLDGTGQPLQRYPYESEQRAGNTESYLITTALQETVRHGTGKALPGMLGADLGIAGKTGTSDERRDAWFAGWSGNYLGVVWVGYDDNRPTELTGTSGALPIWGEAMKHLDLAPLNPIAPQTVEWVWIDPELQMRTQPHCERALYLPLQKSRIPEKSSRCGDSRGVTDWLRRWFGQE
jgi:penicillin-binding protein 1B